MLEFKRRYVDPTAETLVVSGLVYVKRRNPVGTTTRWHPSPRLISGGVSEGWLMLGGGAVRITADNGEAVFRILSPPGHYCCHCGEKLSGHPPDCLEHVVKRHSKGGKVLPSPDPNNPSGWRLDSHYTCEVVSLPPAPELPEQPTSSHKRAKRHVPIVGRIAAAR